MMQEAKQDFLDGSKAEPGLNLVSAVYLCLGHFVSSLFKTQIFLLQKRLIVFASSGRVFSKYKYQTFGAKILMQIFKPFLSEVPPHSVHHALGSFFLHDGSGANQKVGREASLSCALRALPSFFLNQSTRTQLRQAHCASSRRARARGLPRSCAQTDRRARAEVRSCGAEVGLPRLSWVGKTADMAPSGSLRIPVAVLLLLLWGAPWAHGRRSDVRVITDENWRELLEGEWMIEFYAPWCPACQNLQPEWESFAEWGEDLEVNIAKIDVTEQPGLSGRFIITALPTIYHCKDGEFRRYQGPRTKKDFINFISDKEWKSIEPVSSWFGPGSILMSSMSALFQLSMWIRTCHNYFIEDLGLPIWGSYTVFALATLLSGLLLGLFMIFVADFLCPSKRRRPQACPSRKLQPESSQPLKKVEEEQEADVEDVSEEESESKEGTNKDFAQNAVRQRSVGPSLATDKS